MIDIPVAPPDHLAISLDKLGPSTVAHRFRSNNSFGLDCLLNFWRACTIRRDEFQTSSVSSRVSILEASAIFNDPIEIRPAADDPA